MKGKTNEINLLWNLRYRIPTSDNVVEATPYSSAFASSIDLELNMSFSYTQLIAALAEKFSIDNNPTSSGVQQYRNHLSTLHSFLAFCGKTSDSSVGIELNAQFDTKLRNYLDVIDVAPRTRRDRAAHLRTIRRLHQAASTGGAGVKPKQPKLSAELCRLVAQAGVAPKTLAKQAGIDTTTLSRWIKGATPREGTLPSLRRLESRLGVPRDTLVQLIERPTDTKTIPSYVPAYRQRAVARVDHKLALKEGDLGELFLQEWSSFFDYKTTAFPLLERQSKGSWRLLPSSVSPALSRLATRGVMVCPTAGIVLLRIRTFLGVIRNLAQDQGGLTLPEAPPITMAWCAHPMALSCYLQWFEMQSGGVRHNGHKSFARTVCSLLRPKTGFLWQQPDTFRHKLPESVRPKTDEDWQDMCEKSHKLLRDYMRSANELSRDPEEPIADLLSLSDPLAPIKQAIRRIEADAAEATPGGVTEARHKRNALLLALLLSNPLRLRTMMSLTWLPNGQGTLKGSPEQGWRLQLQAHHFKNGKTLKGGTYEVKVASWVKPLLDDYILEFRERLLWGNTSPYLFIAHKDGRLWTGLNKAVLKLTRRYLPGSPGFSPHAMRHLVATSWLRAHPDDFLTVAELLNDNLNTVLANYAHLRRDDSFGRYESYLEGLN